MNTDVESIGQLTITQRAVLALGQQERETELIALAAKTVDIKTITNRDGYLQVKAARIALKNERVDLEKRAKVARDDATKFSKAVIAEEKRLIGLVEPEESRLQSIEDVWDAAIEAEKERLIQEEMARVKLLQDRIDQLRNPIWTAASASSFLLERLLELEQVEIDASFEELEQQARDAKDAGLKRLVDLYDAALAREAEQEKLQAEREELARLRAEDAERARVAREAQAKADAEAKAERERLEAAARQEREAEAAYMKAERDAEFARIAADRADNEKFAADRRAQLDAEEAQARAAREVEDARMAAERAEIAKREEAVRSAEAQRPVRGARGRIPSGQDLVELVAKTYQVTPKVALGWLLKIDWTQEKAA